MLDGRDHWIFDLDGTLTVAVHDFDAIRAELGLPAGRPILESLGELPAARAEILHRRLDAIELEIARIARAAPGAAELLDELSAGGARVGIVTRNTRENAFVTLRAAGLDRHFAPGVVVGRESAAPKPRPDALLMLLRGWGAAGDRSVMVGDYLFDLEAGRGAGVATVYVDPGGAFPFAAHADVLVRDLHELRRRRDGLTSP